MKRVLIWSAALCLAGGLAWAAEYVGTLPPQATDGTTSTQTFGWKHNAAGARHVNAAEVSGKAGTYFWLRYRYRQAATWSIVIYTNYALIPAAVDSLEITPASSDTVYVTGLR